METEQPLTTQLCTQRRHIRLTRPQPSNSATLPLQPQADHTTEPMEVFVQSWTGNTLYLTVTRHTRIQAIVNEVAHMARIRPSQISIAVKGRECYPNENISDHDIKHHDLIHAYTIPEKEEPTCLHLPTPPNPPLRLRVRELVQNGARFAADQRLPPDHHHLANQVIQLVGHVIADFLMPTEPTALEQITMVR